MTKEFIKNRKGQKIAVVVEESAGQAKGLAFVLHGHASIKETRRAKLMAEIFSKNNYTAVRFDATNSIGESEGKVEEGTTTSYYEDLEDLIGWSSTQPWYKEPFCLSGGSLGGLCVALYAEKHSEKVKAVAPIVTVVSGKLRLESLQIDGTLDEWKNSGWRTETSSNKKGLIFKIPWTYMEDQMHYDLLEKAKNLTMPAFMIVGDRDKSTPLAHQKILFEAIPGKKELHVIKDAEHSGWTENQLQEFANLFDKWIKSLD